MVSKMLKLSLDYVVLEMTYDIYLKLEELKENFIVHIENTKEIRCDEAINRGLLINVIDNCRVFGIDIIEYLTDRLDGDFWIVENLSISHIQNSFMFKYSFDVKLV